MDFSISLLQPSSYLRKLTKTLFFNWSLLGLVLKRLCYRQVPHVGSHLTSSFVGFPTLEKRRRKDAPNLSSPSPNVRRDKISRSGEPLTLIYIYIHILFIYTYIYILYIHIYIHKILRVQIRVRGHRAAPSNKSSVTLENLCY